MIKNYLTRIIYNCMAFLTVKETHILIIQKWYTYHWLQGDHGIRIVTISSRKSSRVEFSKAKVDFNGEYQCIASNDAGSVVRFFNIELMKLQGKSILLYQNKCSS